MEVKLSVPAIEKLLDYAASGIGSVAGPMLASWKARRGYGARQIAAKGEVEVQRILTEGQASTMHIIASAQAEARSILVSSDSNVQGELDFAQTVTQRIQFQEEKRQTNIGAVVRQAALELGDKDVQDHEPDHDWTARFFSEVQDVSSEEMRSLWAKVLAGKVERPGSTSPRTLSILRNIDQATANLFKTLCSACVSVRPDGSGFLDARVPSLGGNAGENALQKFGLGFRHLNILNEHGLIISDYNSWYDCKVSIGIPSPNSPTTWLRLPFNFQGRFWVLEPISSHGKDQEFRLSGVALTRSGQELSMIVDLQPMDAYVQDLIEFFKKHGFRMTEVSTCEPQSFGKGIGVK